MQALSRQSCILRGLAPQPARTCQPRIAVLSDCCALQCTETIKAHRDDVNAVCFMDDSNQVIASGSDDTLCKVRSALCSLSADLSAAGSSAVSTLSRSCTCVSQSPPARDLHGSHRN